MSKESEEIDAAWFAIKHGWDIEEREYFERVAPLNGFKYPLAQAIHHLWKRCVKENPEFLRAAPQPTPPALQRVIDHYGEKAVSEVAAALRLEFGVDDRSSQTPKEAKS